MELGFAAEASRPKLSNNTVVFKWLTKAFIPHHGAGAEKEQVIFIPDDCAFHVGKKLRYACEINNTLLLYLPSPTFA